MNTTIRQQFPILSRQVNGKPLVFLDGPAGTQMPTSVINAISDYYKTSNANTHGAFITTHETDDLLDRTRQKVADFLGASSPKCISFGQNMTTLNYSLSRGIDRILQPGDEILISQLDHESNRAPWLALREKGVIVKEIQLYDDGTLNYHQTREMLNHRTRLVAVGAASNIFGTVNNIELLRELTYEVGAWLLLDAVHYAAHFPIDVSAWGCDFLLCSAYKFYGPHVGLLYCKPGLLDQLPTDRLRTQDQHAPYSIETGTLNHAAIAGVDAALDFIMTFGEGSNDKARLHSAMKNIRENEHYLGKRLYDGLQKIEGVKVYGPNFQKGLRAPTVSFTVENRTAAEVCQYLAKHNVCAWDGHFYAIRAAEVMGLLEKGGVTRLGISAYTTKEETERVLDLIRDLAGYV